MLYAPFTLHSRLTRCHSSRLCRLALSLLLLGPFLQTAEAQTIEDFTVFPRFKDAKLSPDGRHFALAVPHATQDMIVILDVEDREIVGTLTSEEGIGIQQFWWATNERIAFSTRRLLGSLSEGLPLNDLMAADIDNTDAAVVAGPVVADFTFNQFLHRYPASDQHVMVSKAGGFPVRGPRAVKVDIDHQPRAGQSGTRQAGRPVSDGGLQSPFDSGSFITYEDGEAGLAFMHDPQGRLQVQLYQGSGQGWQAPSAEVQEALREVREVLAFTPARDGLYVITESEHGTGALQEISLDDAAVQTLFSHERYDMQASDIAWASDGTALAVKLVGTFPEIHYFSSHPEAVLQQQVDAAFPEHLVRVISFSEDGRLALVEAVTDGSPPALYLLDRSNNQLSSIGSAWPELADAELGLAEPFIISARDGVRLEGYLTRPRDAVDGEGALVVMPHDDPYATRDRFGFDPEVQLLVSQGFSVLQVNYRGSAGYGSEFAAAGEGQWGSGMIDDIVDATRWVLNENISEAGRVCLYGRGYGAYAALSAAAADSDLYQCVVGYGGFYDIEPPPPPEAPQGRGMAMANPLEMAPPPLNSFQFATLAASEDERRRQALGPRLEQVQAAVMIAHGAADSVAPVAQAQALIDELAAHGHEAESLIIEEAAHGFVSAEHRRRFYTALVDFLERHLD